MAYVNYEKKRAAEKAWRLANPERARAIRQRSKAAYVARHPDRHRASQLKQNARRRGQGPYRHIVERYGISLETYQEMLARQNGLCAICHKANPNGWALAVDHCHVTGKVRALLCMRCNAGIGHFSDDIAQVEKALSYLKSWASP